MPLSDPELREIVAELVTRPGHEKLRSLVQSILVHRLGASSPDVKFELPLPEVHGRLDALLGRTVFEFKSDLRREGEEAERQLGEYLAERQRRTGQSFVGVATDGVDFVPYEVRQGKLVRRTPFRLARGDIKGLPLWLSPFVAARPRVTPDPETVRKELGRESLVYEVAEGRLRELWGEVREHPEVLVKRKLWAERLQLVYGSAIDDDALFFQHTYLTIVAKTMATLVLGAEIPAPAELLSGKPFQDAGIGGVVESDFFDWPLLAPGADDLIRKIAAQVARFRLTDIQHDVLKVLYESLIDPQQRHDLGEYYTPDWLAQRMCERVMDKPLSQRVLDPACGSGTFLFHAVRRFLDAADAAKLSNAQALAQCTANVLGIDVHPVAAINARITYLLAIGEQRLRDRPRLSIPVYLGDSVQWNTGTVVSGQEIRIDVPDGPALVFPIRLAQNPALLDAVINEMLALSEARASSEAFLAWLDRLGAEEFSGGHTRRTLEKAYVGLRDLRAQNRNHIWGYVARNLSRPVWLSSPGERVDVLIGNPPWLSYRYMSSSMQKRFREQSRKVGLWAGGKVATHQDLSAYFFVRCMELYLRQRGKIAFVLPYATMTRQQYRGFITHTAKGEKGPVTVPARRFTEAWVFDETVAPLFNVPSCVLFAEQGEPGLPLPSTATAFSGQLPARDATARQASEALKLRSVPWPMPAKSSESFYVKRFRNGATVFPRRLFVVVRVPAGRFGTNPEAPLVESRKSSQEKEPWKSLPPLTGPVEKEFLGPLYLGESIAPFRLLEPAEAVIPWTGKLGLLDAKAAQNNGYAHLARWLKLAEGLWNKHGKGRMTLRERLDYQHELVSQMPPAKLRVVYSKAGTLPAAAILTNQSAVIENTLYWTAPDSEQEALYLAAVLNSETARRRAAPYQSKGQWGARHFDKLLSESIPHFDVESELHAGLAALAARATKVAATVAIPNGAHFIRTRQKIREALREDGVAAEIDKLVEKLLAG